MSSESSSSSGGIGFGGALFLVFLVLKLTHVIDWSWWWITAPIWGSFVLFGLIFGVGFLIYLAVDPKTRAQRQAQRLMGPRPRRDDL